MNSKLHDEAKTESFRPFVDPLRQLSAEQFAALGAQSVVYVRQIDASALGVLMPDSGINPHAGMLSLLVSADGTPVMVTDNLQALHDWIDEREVSLATVH